jgi:hypothetical protein
VRCLKVPSCWDLFVKVVLETKNGNAKTCVTIGSITPPNVTTPTMQRNPAGWLSRPSVPTLLGSWYPCRELYLNPNPAITEYMYPGKTMQNAMDYFVFSLHL